MQVKTQTRKPIKNEPDFSALTTAILEAGTIVEAEKVNAEWYSIGEGKYISVNHTTKVPTVTTTRKDKKAE